VESYATLPLLDRIVSFEITPKVTQGGDIADEDVNIDKDQGSVMGDILRFYCS